MSPESTTVFKVCYEKSWGNWESCCRSEDFPTKYKASYRIGVATLPTIPGSRLFAFKTAEAAASFRREFRWAKKSFVILRCEATGISHPIRRLMVQLWKVLDFWKKVRAHKGTGHLIGCAILPKGTLYCKSITPVELVKME